MTKLIALNTVILFSYNHTKLLLTILLINNENKLNIRYSIRKKYYFLIIIQCCIQT